MTIGASLLLIAVGAVLKWAVTAHTNGFDIQTAGTIVFIVGLAGLPLSLLYTFWWTSRTDPRVALTILDEGGWYSHVSLIGRVREIRPDPELADIDRLSQRYRGEPYRDRGRDSWTAIVEVSRWHAWGRLARS